jgi:predicted O-methyltransferase YrrM
MHHSTFIGHLASIYRPTTYVELGLYEGETLRLVQPYAGHVYGVDMKMNGHLEQLGRLSNVTINTCMTNEFFDSFAGTIDMAFIDADHCLESVQQDFENVLSRLNPGGVILLHDTDPQEDRLIDPGYCGDSYKIVKLLEGRADINIVTLPITEAGLSIVTRKDSTRTALRQSRISPS